MSDSATCSKSYQEFVKFGKFFTTRLVQALVQSRLGQLIVQPCSVSPDPADWFSIRIDELGEVAAQLRTSVTKYPPNANCFTLDFLLHTADGDILPLESWCVRYESELFDGSVNVRTELYHHLGTLLKSAIIASRMTPAYRYYVRKQSSDTFIIMYRVYEKEPEMDLGEEQKKVRIGLVTSPFGGFSVDLLYRTKMEIDRTTTQELGVSTVPSSENVDTNGRQSKVDEDIPMLIPFGPVPLRGGDIKPGKIDGLELETFSRRVHFHLGHSRSSSDDAGCRGDVCNDENIFGLDRSNNQPYSSSLPHRLASVKNRARTHSFPFSTLLNTATSDSIQGGRFSGSLEGSDKLTPTSPVHSPSLSPTLVASGSACSAPDTPSRVHHSTAISSGVNLMNNKASEKQEDGSAEEIETQSDDDDDDDDDDDGDDNDDNDDLTSSDDSYVKVAFGSSESLADGLGEFMKQCRSAPTHLSFQIDSTSLIPKLLTQFENNQKIFDNFLEEIKRKADSEED